MTFEVLAGPDFWCLAWNSSWGSSSTSPMAAVTLSAISTTSSAAGVTCSSHLEWNLLDSLFCLSHRTNSGKPGSFVNVLEKCNPVVLVLILTLVLVGRLSAGARGSKKSVLLAFLLSIRHSQNYNILEWGTQRNNNISRFFSQRSRFNFNRGTWVLTHEKIPGNGNPLLFPRHSKTKFRFHFQDTPKQNSVLVSKTLQNGIPFPFPRHSETEFHFRFWITLLYNPQ